METSLLESYKEYLKSHPLADFNDRYHLCDAIMGSPPDMKMQSDMSAIVGRFKNEFEGFDYNRPHDPVFKDIVKKIRQFIDDNKTEILLAWWAKHGFEPGEAVLVERFHEGEFQIFIRKSVDGELVIKA